jgi:hypothetical protein
MRSPVHHRSGPTSPTGSIGADATTGANGSSMANGAADDVDLRTAPDTGRGTGQDDRAAQVVERGRHHGEHRRRNLLMIVTVSAIALVPWIVNLYLTLPHRYLATDWRLTWVGFDIALLAFLTATAWLGWHRRQLVLLTAFTTGVLLCCDAWFDITTAEHHDRLTSVASAFVEIPLAILLFRASWRLLRLAASRQTTAPHATFLSVWRMPMLGPADPAADPATIDEGRFDDPCAQPTD